MLAEALGELLFDGVIIPLLRLPGALLAWAVHRRRSFKQVWLDGNSAFQILAGIGIHILWILLVIIS